MTIGNMFIWMFCQWGFLLLGIYLIIRWIKSGNREDKDPIKKAISIAKKRMTEGEITEEEYERIVKILKEAEK